MVHLPRAGCWVREAPASMIAADRYRSGFSLIELMVAIAILAISLRIAVPSLQSWIENTRVRSTAESIMAGFQIAKNEALRRNAPVRISLNTDTSWLVGCDPANDADADADGLEDCPSNIKSRSMKDGSTNVTAAITPNGATSVLYSGFGRAVGGDENPITSVDVPAAAKAGVTSLRIVVTGGGVRMCVPTVASGDPRAC